MSVECELQINGGILSELVSDTSTPEKVAEGLDKIRGALREREPFLVKISNDADTPNKLLVGNKTVSVDHADTADNADHASTADRANRATDADNADHATIADKANKVVTPAIYNSLSDAQADINNLENGQLIFIKNIES